MPRAGPSSFARYSQEEFSNEESLADQEHSQDSDLEGSSDDGQPDAPRVAQWVDEDELDEEEPPLDEIENEESSGFVSS
jgi:ribosomal RNA-processing protein 36